VSSKYFEVLYAFVIPIIISRHLYLVERHCDIVIASVIENAQPLRELHRKVYHLYLLRGLSHAISECFAGMIYEMPHL
jgi:hypothetical protein